MSSATILLRALKSKAFKNGYASNTLHRTTCEDIQAKEKTKFHKLIIVNPFMPSRFFYLKSLDKSISYIRGIWLVFIIIMFCRNF